MLFDLGLAALVVLFTFCIFVFFVPYSLLSAVLPARWSASAVFATAMCLSVCLSHSGIVSKWLNRSKTFRHLVAQLSSFFDPLHRYIIPRGTPSYPPKLPQKWAWIGNFKPNGQNIKIAISHKILTRSMCNFRRMLEPSNTNRGWSGMTSYQTQDGGRTPFWKSKIRNNSATHHPIFTKFCRTA